MAGALAPATGALVLSSVPASAASAVEIGAPHTARVGKTITVKAHADDDRVGYPHQLCLEENGFGQGWHQERCGTPARGEARVTAQGTSARGGDLRFRAVLYGLAGKHYQKPVRLGASDVVTVRVR
ncbi:hypothetical protein [Streptomyces sp. NPDC007088]|uniref:hypothetical protein n=1 Tax=Streptomyces sp. NPDC007088 TaxID=3364773 RepID=UPI0036817587